VALPALLALGVAGCGGGGTGTVTGKLTSHGQPLKGGNMTFVSADGRSFLATIGEDGSYTVDNVPVGEAKITVETESLKRQARLPMGKRPADAPGPKQTDPAEAAKHYVKIDPKYAQAELSPLTYTVKAGKQEYDIKLD